MPSVLYKGESYEVEAGESVLDCLTRNGHEIPYSCKSGVCQSCLMKAESGTLPAKSQAGLNAPTKAEHYFMACVCMPETDLVVAGAAALSRPVSA